MVAPQLVYTVGSSDTDRASVQVAISRLLDLFMRDFVLSWYVPYVSDDLELLRAAQLSLELATQELARPGILGIDLYNRIAHMSSECHKEARIQQVLVCFKVAPAEDHLQ